MLTACDLLSRGLPEVVAAELDRAKWLRLSRSVTVGTAHPAPAGTSMFTVSIRGARTMTLNFSARTAETVGGGGQVEVFFDEARNRLAATVSNEHFGANPPGITVRYHHTVATFLPRHRHVTTTSPPVVCMRVSLSMPRRRVCCGRLHGLDVSTSASCC